MTSPSDLVARKPSAPMPYSVINCAPTHSVPSPGGVGPASRIPTYDPTNPADLEAWFGPFGYAEVFRKIILASCREIARARATEKISEAKIDDLARTSDSYVDFAIQCLNGRRSREQNVRDSVMR